MKEAQNTGEKEPKLKYELFQDIKEGIPKKVFDNLNTLGEKYEKDIDGIDMGFNSLVYLSDYLFIAKNRGNIAGFILGRKSELPFFKEEKSFCPTAVYLKPYYRNKTGKYKDVLKNVFGSLVDTLEKNNFFCLNVFPDGFGSEGLVTDVGANYVLKSLYELLQSRAKELNVKEVEMFPIINAGSNNFFDDFNPIYLFDVKSFNEKVKQRLRSESPLLSLHCTSQSAHGKNFKTDSASSVEELQTNEAQ